MAIRTLSIDDPLDVLLEETVTTLTLLRADPLAAPLAPKFDALIVDFHEVSALRVELVIAVAGATAKAFYLDEQLNRIVDELVALLQKITKRDKSDPLWKVFLAGKDPFSFKRPILSGQLAAMRVWPASIAGTSHKELKALGAKLIPILADADVAEKDVMATKQKLVDFRNVGRFRQHVDKSNAERKAAFGILSELPHKHPELKLPSDYADLFFLHDTSRRGAGTPPGSEEIGKEIKALEDQITALREDQAAALEREQASAAAEAKREEQRAALAQAKKEQEAAKAKADALEKELKKKK